MLIRTAVLLALFATPILADDKLRAASSGPIGTCCEPRYNWIPIEYTSDEKKALTTYFMWTIGNGAQNVVLTSWSDTTSQNPPSLPHNAPVHFLVVARQPCLTSLCLVPELPVEFHQLETMAEVQGSAWWDEAGRRKQRGAARMWDGVYFMYRSVE
jgi:hypothetical protein